MLLPTISGKIWTHKIAVDYTQLQNPVPSTPYQDMFLFGLPANHMVVAVKITTLVNFTANNPGETLYVYVGHSGLFPAATSGQVVVSSVPHCYGMGILAVDTEQYQYGSFAWFTVSAPGGATFSQNQIPGSTLEGAYCQPQRFDAHDIIARFVLLGSSGLPDRPTSNTAYSFVDVTAGSCEIAIQYTVV